ncbi:MAG: VOC family protein [Pseudomonadota bacterium]
MIGYVTLGASDLERAGAFYDALLGEVGATRFMDMDGFIAWSNNPKGPALSIVTPYDGNTCSVGNGVMIALAVDAPEKVDALYKKAMELGATDEGAPGKRLDNFYAAYFRDLDGNKLNFFCMT